jgi:hypothetical protein
MMAPLPPAPKSPDRTPWLIAGLVTVLVLAVCSASLYLVHLAAQGRGSTSSAVVYQNSLTCGPNALTCTPSGWSEGTYCFEGPDGYHIKDNYICNVPTGQLQDFMVEVTMRELSGPTNYPYKITFRMQYPAYYEFNVYANGDWAMYKCTTHTEPCVNLAGFNAAPAIHQGIGVPNSLAVRGQRSQFTFFINGQQVGQATDSSYLTGLFGLSAVSGMEVVATNLTITRLS